MIGGGPSVPSELTALLLAHGINAGIEGSIVYGIRVGKESECEALKIILEYACDKGYYANLRTREDSDTDADKPRRME